MDAKLIYSLTGADYTAFEAEVGLSDEHDYRIDDGITSCTVGGNVIFIFKIDGSEIYRTEELTGLDAPLKVQFDIPTEASTLTILVNSIENFWCDTAILGNAPPRHR